MELRSPLYAQQALSNTRRPEGSALPRLSAVAAAVQLAAGAALISLALLSPPQSPSHALVAHAPSAVGAAGAALLVLGTLTAAGAAWASFGAVCRFAAALDALLALAAGGGAAGMLWPTSERGASCSGAIEFAGRLAVGPRALRLGRGGCGGVGLGLAAAAAALLACAVVAVGTGRQQRRKREQRMLPSPWDDAGFLSVLSFSWIYRVLRKGWRSKRLEPPDLPPLPAADRADVLAARFERFWKEQLRRSPSGGPSLLSALVAAQSALFWSSFWLQAVASVLYLAQPKLLHLLLLAIDAKQDDSNAECYVLAVSLWLAVLFYWIGAELRWFLCMRIASNVRSILTYAVYRRGVALHGQGSDYDEGALSNLLATDAPKVLNTYVVPIVQQMLLFPAVLGVALWQLHSLLGRAAWVGVALIATLLPLSVMLSTATKPMVNKVQQKRDERASLLTQVLRSIREVKLAGWQTHLQHGIDAAREAEMQQQASRQYLLAANSFVSQIGSVGVVAASLLWYSAVEHQTLQAPTAFAAVAWFALVQDTIGQLPWAVGSGVNARVSLLRLQELFVTADAIAAKSAAAPLNDIPVVLKSRERLALHADAISWEADGSDPVLTDVRIRIQQGELCVICGAVGSGKSSLLAALAGALNTGAVQRAVSGRVAYVGASPWLQNQSLRDNILFGSIADPRRYSETLAACALTRDIDSLAAGDRTVVGSEGVQLSGGQRQRLALARAVYANSDIYCLDDVLSAVDAETGRHLWQQVILDGLRGKTRILAMHSLSVLADPAVSRVILLKDGKISAHGTYSELLAQGALDKAEVEHAPSREHTPSPDPAAAADRTKAQTGQKVQDDDSDESRSTGYISADVFLAYCRSFGSTALCLLVIVCVLAYNACLVFSNVWLSMWVDATAAEQPSYVLIYAASVAVAAVLLCGRVLLIVVGTLAASRKLHKSMTDSVLSAKLGFFDVSPLGRILNRFLQDQTAIDERVPSELIWWVEATAQSLGIVCVLGYAAPWALIGVPLLAFPYQRVTAAFRFPMRDLRRIESVSKSPVMDHFAESLRGAATTRAFGAEGRFLRRLLTLTDETAVAFYSMWAGNAWFTNMLECAGTLLLLGTALVAIAGERGGGFVGLALTYALNLPRQLMWLARKTAELEVELIAVERVVEYCKLEPEELAGVREHVWPAATTGAAGAIRLQGVSMRYKETSPLVLDKMTLEVSAGEKVAVVGRTGGGKSSLMAALLRLYPICEGSLQLDGVDIHATSDLASLRSVVRMMLQTPALFQGTVKSNVVGARNLDPDRDHEADIGLESAVKLALEKAGLGELGLDEEVQADGANLSSGQRAMVCFARLLVQPPGAAAPRVIVVDEATSNVDAETEKLVQSTLMALPCTVLAICHDMEWARRFERVIVVSDGRVAESGRPADLEAAGGAFAELLRLGQ